MARALVAAGRLPVTAVVHGSARRCHPVGDPQQSRPPADRALGATTAQTRGPPRAPRAERAARTLLGTGGAPPAIVARGSPWAPRSACQPASPFGAPALQHLPAAFRRHALAESVRLGAPATVRLERPLHCVLLVRVLRTARSSYRWAADPVKRCATAHGRRAVAASKIPMLWWAARFGDGVRTLGYAGVHTGPGRAANPVRQATTAGLPELSTAVDKCVRNLPA